MPLRIVDPKDSKHFRERLFERFGVLLTASDMWPLRDQLKTATRVEIDKEGVGIYLMNIQNRWVHVLYNTRSQRFITAELLSTKELVEVATIKDKVVSSF